MDISFFIGLLLAIPTGLFVNLLTPKVQVYLAKYSSSYRKRRRRNLSRELKLITSLRNDSNKLIAYVFREVADYLMFLIFLLTLGVMTLYFHNEAIHAFTNELSLHDSSFRWIASILGLGSAPAYSIFLLIKSIGALLFMIMVYVTLFMLMKTMSITDKLYRFDKYKQETEAIINSEEGDRD